MTNCSQLELQEALYAMSSLLHKCETFYSRLKKGTSQHTLMTRRIAALKISIMLIEGELNHLLSL